MTTTTETKTIEIHVTFQDIEAGLPMICSLDPVSMAICRTMGIERKGVMVHDEGIDRVDVATGDMMWTAYVPDAVVEFIADYDLGRPVSPFVFSMEYCESN